MKKKLVMISPVLRRDLHAPLRFFKKFAVYHIYQDKVSGDLLPDDMQGNEIQYRGQRDLYQILTRLRPAIIQGSEPTWFPKTLPVCRATRNLGKEIPLYFPMLENKLLGEKFGFAGGLLMKKYLAWYASTARLIFAVNEGAERNLLDAGVPAAKIQRRLYGTWGVDLEEFYPGKKEREPLILFVGRLEADKGIWYLIDAFLKLRDEIPAARLEIIGNGPLRSGLQTFLAERKLAEVIKLRGAVPNRMIADEFRRARVACVPALALKGWEEQVGMANLQALACGTPVVSTWTGANPEMINNGVTGKLVAPRQSDTLATALAEMLTDDQSWQAMSTAAVKAATERFDARRNIAEIEEELLRILV